MLLLKNATYIHPSSLSFNKVDILCKADCEISLHPSPSMITADETLDCTDLLVTQSFACGHHHAYSALARGMGAPKKVPQNFLEVLQYVWWTLDKCLDRDMIEASALATAIACARNGVTYVIDHHASPHAIEGSLDIIARTFEKVGIGHLLCYEISDRDGPDIANKGLEETERYLQTKRGLVGLHAGFTVGDDTLKRAVSLAEKHKTGIHIHTAEDIHDEDFSLKTYGKRVVERFSDAGVLNLPASILVHCLHLNEKERSILNKAPVWVAQNSDSNQNNRVGTFSSFGLSERIMLGTDGMHSDMLRSSKSAFLNAPKEDGLSYMDIYHRLRKVHQYLEENDFASKEIKDLVVLDYPSPSPVTADNFAGHFIFGIESSHIRHVISNGRLIVKEKEIVNLDEEEALNFTKEQALRLWKKMSS